MSYSRNKFDQLIPSYIIDLLPKQKRGISRDTITVYKEENVDLQIMYEKFKKRLQKVNQWVDYTSVTNLDFKIFNSEEFLINREVKIGDLIKIQMNQKRQIPIIGKMMSDWVYVNEIIEFDNNDERFYSLQLIPVESPNLDEIKHFYNEMASNTFILYQNKNFVSLSIHGRNEFPNLISKSRFRIIRNIMIANLSLIGIDNFLWNNFATNLLKP